VAERGPTTALARRLETQDQFPQAREFIPWELGLTALFGSKQYHRTEPASITALRASRCNVRHAALASLFELMLRLIV
jgi:hypothetical protein